MRLGSRNSRRVGNQMDTAMIFAWAIVSANQAELNDSAGLWCVERLTKTRAAKIGQLFFGQFRTLGPRKSARFVQTP